MPLIGALISLAGACIEAMADKQKSEQKMLSLIGGGTTVLFVSHSTEQIRKLCPRALWLEHGELMEDGPSDIVCRNYLAAAGL